MKGKRIKLVVIIILMVISTFKIGIPTARADGASSIEEVLIEWTYTTNLGMTSTSGSGNSLEDDTFLNFFNVTDTAIDVDYSNLTIYYMQGRIYSDDVDDREVRAYAYNWTSNTDAGARYGQSIETWPESPPGSYTWKGGTLTTPLNVGNVTIFYYGLWADGEDGSYFLDNPEVGGFALYRNNNPGDDPFTETGVIGDAFAIRFRVRGQYNTTTEHNLYVGNTTHYTARRDINYTFPVGVVNEQITMSYPIAEQIFNITTYNGGGWDHILDLSEYSTSSLNATHDLLTIPEATINLFDGIYRVYTNTFSYYYTFPGAFYENGTSYGAVNITADTEGGTVTILVDGETAYGTDDEVFSIQWDVGEAYRFIYPSGRFGRWAIFFPDEDYATYEFEIRDFTGDLHLGSNNWLSSWRYINGTNQLIEQILIQDVVNNIPLTLVTYQTYTLMITFYDMSTYEFGFFVSGAIANPVLALTEIAFSSRAQFTYQYVTVEATRTLSTQITINYEDSLEDTESVILLIEYRNGTDIYTDTAFDDTYQWNWASANEYTDYLITVTITHGVFGTLTYQEAIGVGRPFNPFPSLGTIGTFGPIAPGNLFSMFIVSVCALAFSALSAEVGGFVAVIVAATLRYWGVNNFSYTTLGIAGAIVVLYAVMRRSTK